MIDDPRLPGRFWDKVVPEPNTGCWLWTASVHNFGYGKFRINGRSLRAHRLTYETLVGPVPRGMQLDHVKARGCCGPECCNPDHLEVVTPQVNSLRSTAPCAMHARKTHCPAGHPYDEENTGYVRRRARRSRRCATCHRERERARMRRMIEQGICLGCRGPAQQGRQRCDECLARNAARTAARAKGRRLAEEEAA